VVFFHGICPTKIFIKFRKCPLLNGLPGFPDQLEKKSDIMEGV
jgi:hypothetical protein